MALWTYQKQRWIGLTPRNQKTTSRAVDWNPQGQKRAGRLPYTCRRQLEKEIGPTGCSWAEMKRLASNRIVWNDFVTAICPCRKFRKKYIATESATTDGECFAKRYLTSREKSYWDIRYTRA